MYRRYSLLLIMLFHLISCGRSHSPEVADAGDNYKDAPYEVSVIVLSKGVTSIGGQSFAFDLLKISDNVGTVAYAQWIYQNSNEPRPTILAIDPYTGISWSNEAVDLDWASYPNAALGYAGGDLENEKAEIKAALGFLKSSSLVKTTAVGVYGMSWGGFEALHGVAFARDILSPKVGVAVAPLSDFADQLKYIKSDIPSLIVNSSVETSYLDFFDAYLRRIFSSTKTYDWNSDFLKR